MREKRVNAAKFFVVSMILVLFLTMAMSIKANGREKNMIKSNDAAETVYRNGIKAVLKDNGAKNAGVNLTKITEDGQHFEYKVVINLPGYLNLDNMEKENLLNELYEVELGMENADVTISFS